MMEQMGGYKRSYRRERAAAFRRVVTEVYSPPRLTSMIGDLRKQGLGPGLSLDITCTDKRLTGQCMERRSIRGRKLRLSNIWSSCASSTWNKYRVVDTSFTNILNTPAVGLRTLSSR
jgi:hypothetical protein